MNPILIIVRGIQFLIGRSIVTVAFIVCFLSSTFLQAELERLKYNHPGLIVDLGVGLWAWPLPMDFDKDGDYDLVVVCPDKPFNGTYFFENTDGDVAMPVFQPPVRISGGNHNVQISYVNGMPRVLSPGIEHNDFYSRGIDSGIQLPVKRDSIYQAGGRIRARQWKYVDFDGDNVHDLVAAFGDWTDYGWDDAYDSHGVWSNGPLHGFVFWLKNHGSDSDPHYGEPKQIMAGDQPVDVYGWPSPNFGDFDHDGDLDLLCGEFLDTFTYFENRGTRTDPVYAPGRKLLSGDEILRMDLQMIVPVTIDWDKDGDLDIICGDEDGRVAYIENTGCLVDGLPHFLEPKYFQQIADDVKFGALVTPYGVDWDADGDMDMICGNTAGYIGFFENLGGGDNPVWNRVELLKAEGRTIRIQAGPNGSIQGPAEAKLGYTKQTVADWDHDGLLDIIVTSIWGKVIWFRNIGVKGKPLLESARPVLVNWAGTTPKPSWNWWNPVGDELVTQWRTTPVAVDWNKDGLTDLVMLDHEGHLAFFERAILNGSLALLPGKRIFVDEDGEPLAVIRGPAGKSGRRKLHIVDWDGDGLLDVLMNGENADYYRNLGEMNGRLVLKQMGPLDSRKVSGHTSSPTVVDWNENGIPDLLVGAEDGHLYYKVNSRER